MRTQRCSRCGVFEVINLKDKDVSTALSRPLPEWKAEERRPCCE